MRVPPMCPMCRTLYARHPPLLCCHRVVSPLRQSVTEPARSLASELARARLATLHPLAQPSVPMTDSLPKRIALYVQENKLQSVGALWASGVGACRRPSSLWPPLLPCRFAAAVQPSPCVRKAVPLSRLRGRSS